MSTAENDVVKEIRSEYQYGFSNPDDAGLPPLSTCNAQSAARRIRAGSF